MKQLLSLLLLVLSVSAYSATVSSSVTPMLDLSGTNSTIVDKINQYNIRQSLASEYERIVQMSEDKIYFEAHLGMGASYYLGNTGIVNNYDPAMAINTNKTAFAANLLFKFNLFNPKMPYYTSLISEIAYLKELTEQQGYTLSASASSKIESIQKKIDAYNSEFWYKRLSVGVGIPLNFIPQNFNVSSQNSYSLYGSFFVTQDTFFFVGYDLGDLCTLELGSNFYFNRVFLGISFDITTPLYQSSSRFLDFFKNTFGQNKSSSVLSGNLN